MKGSDLYLTMMFLLLLLAVTGAVVVIGQEQTKPLMFYREHPPCRDAQRVVFPSSLIPYASGMTAWVCE